MQSAESGGDLPNRAFATSSALPTLPMERTVILHRDDVNIKGESVDRS